MRTPKKGNPKKGKEPLTPTQKKATSIIAEINKGKAELSDDELKKVTGGAPRRLPFTQIE